MPSTIVIPRAQALEGSDVFIAHRLVKADGTNVTQADITSTISVRVFDRSGAGEGRAPDTPIYTDTTISKTTGGPGGGAAILDALATTYWDGQDSEGYNFIYRLQWDSSGSAGPYLRAGHRYYVAFEADVSGEGTMRWAMHLTILPGDPQ